MSKGEATRDRLRRIALQLLSEHGYDDVTVAQIASSAGVSHMTFFRHFSTKEAVVVSDLFDPVIAAGIGAQPTAWAPLRRAVMGLLAALEDEDAQAELASVEFAQRIRLAASAPSLRGAVRASSQATEDAIADALRGPGVDPLTARAAAAAVMGAATSLLLEWATPGSSADEHTATDPVQVLRSGLASLVGGLR